MTKLTEGKPGKVLLLFTLPMIIGNLFQQLYNTVDSVVLGQFATTLDFAAVTSTFSVVFLSIAIINGITMGVSVIISQYFGAKKFEEMRRAFGCSIIFMGITAVLLTGLMMALINPILSFMNPPDGTLPLCQIYLFIYMGGTVFNFAYSAFAAILRAIGDSRTPLYFLIVACVVNIGLDLLFVVQFHMGAAGVAIATVIAQAVSAVGCIIYTFAKKPILRLHKGDFHLDADMTRRMLKFGVPTAIQQATVSLGMMVVQGLINSKGAAFMAGFGAGSKIDSFATLPIINFGIALSSFTGQNVGAGRLDRVKQGVRATLLMSGGFCLVVSVLCNFAAPSLMHLFLKPEETAAIAVGSQYIGVISLFYLLFMVLHVLMGVLRGSGDIYFPLLSALMVVAVRAPLAYILSAVPAIGDIGIWLSMPIAWAASDLLLFLRYKSGKWKEKSLVHAPAAKTE